MVIESTKTQSLETKTTDVNKGTCYKAKLVNSESNVILSIVYLGFEEINLYPEEDNIIGNEAFIPLPLLEKQRLYQPWEKSLLIKVFDRKVGYKYLLHKLQQL